MRLKFRIIVTRGWNLGKIFCKCVCYISERCNFFVTILQMFDWNWRSFSRDFINNVPYFFKRCAAVNGRNKTMPWLTSGCFYSSSAFGLDDFVALNIVVCGVRLDFSPRFLSIGTCLLTLVIESDSVSFSYWRFASWDSVCCNVYKLFTKIFNRNVRIVNS